MSVAGEMAVYLENSRLYRDLQELLLGFFACSDQQYRRQGPLYMWPLGTRGDCGAAHGFADGARGRGRREPLPNRLVARYRQNRCTRISAPASPVRLVEAEFEQIRRHPENWGAHLEWYSSDGARRTRESWRITSGTTAWDIPMACKGTTFPWLGGLSCWPTVLTP